MIPSKLRRSPTVTTSGSSCPKLFLRRFIEALAVASDAPLGESGQEGGVCLPHRRRRVGQPSHTHDADRAY